MPVVINKVPLHLYYIVAEDSDGGSYDLFTYSVDPLEAARHWAEYYDWENNQESILIKVMLMQQPAKRGPIPWDGHEELVEVWYDDFDETGDPLRINYPEKIYAVEKATA